MAADQLLNEGHVGDALRLFQASLDDYPEAWSVFANYGEACSKAGKKDLAVKAFERSLALDPSQTEVRRGLEQLKGAAKK